MPLSVTHQWVIAENLLLFTVQTVKFGCSQYLSLSIQCYLMCVCVCWLAFVGIQFQFLSQWVHATAAHLSLSLSPLTIDFCTLLSTFFPLSHIDIARFVCFFSLLGFCLIHLFTKFHWHARMCDEERTSEEWYRPGQQTLNHITLIKVIICNLDLCARHTVHVSECVCVCKRSVIAIVTGIGCAMCARATNCIKKSFPHVLRCCYHITSVRITTANINSLFRLTAVFAFIFFCKITNKAKQCEVKSVPRIRTSK